MQDYQYKPLINPNDIHLIHLLPGALNEPLFGRVVHFSLDEERAYSALSYAWQGDVKNHILNTPEGDIPITDSLNSALLHLRQSEGEIVLWADAICINQADDDEKGHQADDSALGLELIEKLAIDWDKEYGVVGDIAWEDYEKLGLPTRDEKPWEAFRTILRRPWFRRIWVVQELAVAKSVTVACGSSRLPWQIFGSAVLNIRKYYIRLNYDEKHDETLTATVSGEMAVFLLVHIKGDLGKTSFILLDLLYLFRHTHATKARDHLFALLGLASDADDSVFDPNYTEPFESIIRRYAKEFVKRGQVMKLLGTAGLKSNSARFPSWVPDWTQDSLQFDSLNSFPPRRLWHIFLAGVNHEPEAYVDDAGNTLRLRGFLFDIVTRVGQPWYGHLRSDFEYFRIYNLLEKIDNMVATLSSYPTGESVRQAHARTLIRNHISYNEEAPQAVATLFQEAEEFLRMKTEKLATEEFLGEDWPVVSKYLRQIVATLRAKRFFITAKGYMGLCPSGTQLGDTICVPVGCIAPFVIRKSDDREGYFRLVGECYLHGIMKGEAFEFEDAEVIDIFLW